MRQQLTEGWKRISGLCHLESAVHLAVAMLVRKTRGREGGREGGKDNKWRGREEEWRGEGQRRVGREREGGEGGGERKWRMDYT